MPSTFLFQESLLIKTISIFVESTNGKNIVSLKLAPNLEKLSKLNKLHSILAADEDSGDDDFVNSPIKVSQDIDMLSDHAASS